MRTGCLALMLGIAALPISTHATAHTPALETQSDSTSYLLGRDVAAQLLELGAEIQMGPFMAGFSGMLEGDSSRIDSLAADSLRRQFALQAQEKLEQEQAREAATMKEQSSAFLLANKARPGVQTTASGLQYEVVQAGEGPKPKPTDEVTVTYRGTLLDSSVFDSTAAGQVATFDLEKVIPGIREGMLLMSPGATYRLFIPPELAYGVEGIPPIIPPNALLIFEVTLQEILIEEEAGAP